MTSRARDIANFGDGIATADIGDGQITTAKIASGAITDALLPAGSVLQVVNGTHSSQVDTTSGSYVDTGLSATITPTSASNTILVIVQHQISISSATGYGNVRLLRDSTGIITFAVNLIASDSVDACGIGTSYLDSPATTSAITYKTQIQRTSGGGTFTSQQNGATATITLMEIAG